MQKEEFDQVYILFCMHKKAFDQVYILCTLQYNNISSKVGRQSKNKNILFVSYSFYHVNIQLHDVFTIPESKTRYNNHLTFAYSKATALQAYSKKYMIHVLSQIRWVT